MSSAVTDYKEVILDGTRFKLIGDMSVTAVDRLRGKITIGAYNEDSNDLISTWAITDLTGGHGIAEHQEGTTDNRYRFGTIYTRYPKQFSKPFRTIADYDIAGSYFPLGDMYYSGNSTWETYSAFGNNLYRDHATNIGSMSSPPSDRAVVFQGTAAKPWLFIPLSSGGHATYDRATNTLTVTNAVAGDDFASFLVWDEKLIGITRTGQMRYTLAAANAPTWVDYELGGVDVVLDQSHQPQRLHAYYSRAGVEVPVVVTDIGVWAFDASVPKFYRIPDIEGYHPFFGYSSCVWRGELYIASGMDILAWNGEIVRNIGLSRDQGLPHDQQNYVRDLIPGPNALYAWVRGRLTNSSTVYHSSLHEWSGFGWHCIQSDHYTGSAPTRGGFSRSNDDTRLFWGHANGSYFAMSLPRAQTNPAEAVTNASESFGLGGDSDSTETYYLETGRFNANMRGYAKIANSAVLRIKTLPSNNKIVVKYRVDSDTSWTQLGSDITTSGHHTLLFGTVDAYGVYPGEPFEDIEFRWEYVETSANSTTPIIESFVFSFLPLMHPSESFSCLVDLTAPHHDQSPDEMRDKINDLRTSQRFFSMQYKDTTYRVRIAQRAGEQAGGEDTRGTEQLSIIEIPETVGVL